jgi:CRP-like cAMP-binding protein
VVIDKDAKIYFLKSVQLLSALSSEELERVAQLAQHRQSSRYNFIFMHDEPADCLFLLVKGKVKTGAFSADGREVIKEILAPGAVFGDLILSGETSRSEFAQALHDDVEYLAIRNDNLQCLMQENPSLVISAMQHLAQRLQRAEERLAKLVLKDARERIIEFLVESAGREGRRVGYETLVKHYLTQQEIASLTGTSRQTVTSVFNDLKKSNLIYFNRNSILIRDLEKLA